MPEQDLGPAARHASLHKHFMAVLEEQGRALTSAEMAIVDVFINSECHFTLDELCSEARQVDPQVTEDATGEMLQLLCEYKIAHEVNMRGQPLYEHYHLSSHHDHFVCVKCGGVQNFYDPQIENLQAKNARESRFRPLIHRLEIYGVCADCVEKEEHLSRLSDCLAGETVRVARLAGDSETRRRLAGMGIMPREIVRVLGLNASLQTALVAVKGARLALSAELAQKIFVTAVDVAAEEIALPPTEPHDQQENCQCESSRGKSGGCCADAPTHDPAQRESFWFRWRWRDRSKESDDSNE